MARESSDDEGEIDLLQTFKVGARAEVKTREPARSETFGGVLVAPVEDRESYQDGPISVRVEQVLDEIHNEDNSLEYRIKYDDGANDLVSYEDLVLIDGGTEALAIFESQENHSLASLSSEDSYSEPEIVLSVPERKRGRPASGGASKATALTVDSSADELDGPSPPPRTRNKGKNQHQSRSLPAQRQTRSGGRSSTFYELPPSSRSSSETPGRYPKRRVPAKQQRDVRSSSRQANLDIYDEMQQQSGSSEDSQFDILRSDVRPTRKRKRSVNGYDKHQSHGTRASHRSTRHQYSMQEAGMEDVYRSDSDKPRLPPKVTGVKETFQPISRSEPFAIRHIQQCETCGNGSGAHGNLIYCQGCALSYHKSCLGHRTNREHLVTKIGDADFVLQCRRCVNSTKRREPTAPDQAMCQSCRDVGLACVPFRARKTAAQEEKEREEHDGIDTTTDVSLTLINNVNNVLFRCINCWRGFHFHHMVSRNDLMDVGEDDAALAEKRFREYCVDWRCRDCADMPAKVSGLVAWRPIDTETYIPGTDTTEVAEDAKEYLLRWENRSYFQAQWMPGAWIWGVTAGAMRKAFAKRNNGYVLPVMKTEDAIPEDFLRIDIILKVKFTSYVETRAEEVDKARIREVDSALVKYKGLGYEDVVWEKVPTPDDGDRWTDFVKAYDDWVAGRYVRVPKSTLLKARLEKARLSEFTSLEKKVQPPNVSGGELMKYQLDGINWLYYRWYLRKNAILADEMGLGKTIQIIGMLATLVEDHNCFPFLIVVPNSTCANWRREIKQWAPSLRVVTYFGSAQARRMAYEHELFPEGSKTIRCHIVVTSYDAAADDSCKKFLRSVPWQGMIVDEGQRLKSDRTNLYGALSALKVPFSCLLTGTPLQNNARELFNLLQFLDESFDAAALELEYAELTKQNIPQLHNLIRPYFLRRTKTEVLTFLPPMGQVIIPVTMSVVQKKLYKSILAKNPDLLRAIFNHDKSVAKSERANLSNILMQLRKCLCHPFVYSNDIEERNVSAQLTHRNLIDASPKLQLLDLLLAKLKARGSRVLIFSQFLNMLDCLEDFLNGSGLKYQRLDGTMSSLQKQKRIDQFNAPDSELFAFLLSTRAGGVGINLATADTVIIMDPDFNPHQDIQALSRAHRIGQKKKVLCFQLMTQASAEEKIVQIGRKKMALDHVLIDQMDADEDSAVDMESILRFGAAEVLEGDTTKDIRYDEASVDRLLDRSQMEDTKAGEDQTAESQFSFARVWANDAASMMESLNSDDDEDRVPDPGVWQTILQERERAAAEEAARRQQALGRGKRARQTVDYSGDRVRPDETTPQKPGARRSRDSDSDTDFQAEAQEEPESAGEEPGDAEEVAQEAAAMKAPTQAKQAHTVLKAPQAKTYKTFNRSNVVWDHGGPHGLPPNALPSDQARPPPMANPCYACGSTHRTGYCPFKLAGPEHCNLCGLSHYGIARTCPHIRSETQVRAMLAALKESPEDRPLVQEATKYLSGVRGTLAQAKRIKAQKAAMEAVAAAGYPQGQPYGQFQGHGPGPGPGQGYPQGHVPVQGYPQGLPRFAPNGTPNGRPAHTTPPNLDTMQRSRFHMVPHATQRVAGPGVPNQVGPYYQPQAASQPMTGRQVAHGGYPPL